jgi:predicted molibdopterin-dependent oxidoreductase YjgC
MVVRTATPEVEKLRKTLMELVVSENPSGSAAGDIDPLRGMASQELTALAARYQVTGERFAGARSGRTQPDDDNPFILRDYDHCISCYRCVRVCAEQEGDYAISVAGRGFSTQITTEFGGLLVDSACTFCGQCVQTCPTGALGDRKAMRFAVADVANAADAADTADAAAPIAATTAEPVELTRSICPYCGVGCSVDIMTRGEQIVGIRPAVDGPANEGALCVKGQYAYDFVQHPDRLKTPLVRDDNGALVPTSWDEALDRAAAGFEKIFEERGRHGVYAVASGRAPHESAYTVQKWIRTKFGTNYVDNCSRA